MKQKGIPYLFVAKGSENVLTVQVAWENFYDIPFSLDNFDRAMSMLKYCIARPEYALEEIPEIKMRSYTIRDSWNRVILIKTTPASPSSDAYTPEVLAAPGK